MSSTYLPLIGVAVMAVAFLAGVNPLLAVIVASFATGLVTHMEVIPILDAIGRGFVKTRNLPLIILLPVAVIGLLEKYGLREYSERAIRKLRAATVGRLLIAYLFLREVSAAVGLTSLGGQVQMVRPIVAPMAESLAQQEVGALSADEISELRAYAASADNVGLFFGEDIFVAFGAIALMHTILSAGGVEVDPLHIALWGIPTALFAFCVHALRLRSYASRLSLSQRTVAEPDVAANA